MDNAAILAQVGLTDHEARTYLAVLELGSSTIKPIADRAGVKRTSAYNYAQRLLELGLVTQAVIRGRTRYQAVSPSRLADLQRERLRLVEESVPSFLSLFNAAAGKPRMHFYEGAIQMRQALYEETYCRRETSFLLPSADLMEMIGVETMDEVNRRRVQRGIKGRSLRVRSRLMPFPTSAQSTRNLLTVRITPESFSHSMGIGLYDTGKVGYFSSRHEGFAIIIESPELHQLMSSFYDMLWAISVPVRAGEG